MFTTPPFSPFSRAITFFFVFFFFCEKKKKEQTDAVVAWLDSGARRVIVALDVSDPGAVQGLADWSTQLPASRHRLVASFRARDLRMDAGGGGLGEALRAVMDGLRPVVSCVQVDFEGAYAAAPQVRHRVFLKVGEENYILLGCQVRQEWSFRRGGCGETIYTPWIQNTPPNFGRGSFRSLSVGYLPPHGDCIDLGEHLLLWPSS